MLHTSSDGWTFSPWHPLGKHPLFCHTVLCPPHHSMTPYTNLFQMHQSVKENDRSKSSSKHLQSPWTSAFGVPMTLDPYPATPHERCLLRLRRCADQKAVSQVCVLWTVVDVITVCFFYCYLGLILISSGSTWYLDTKVCCFFIFLGVDCFSVSLRACETEVHVCIHSVLYQGTRNLKEPETFFFFSKTKCYGNVSTGRICYLRLTSWCLQGHFWSQY